MSPTLALAQQLIACPSLTPEDAGCQAILARRLERLGFRVETMPSGPVSNLWARLGSEPPLFCFAGQTDVVPPGPRDAWHSDPFVPEVRDGKLFGRGAADMKGGLAAMLVATEQFLATERAPLGSVAFLITSDEEGAATEGTVHVLERLRARGEAIDYCLLGEPSSLQRAGDRILHGRRGSLNATLRILGKQGHIAYPHAADNPIHRFAPTLARLCAETWDQGNAYFPPTSFQVSNLHAGTGAENVIPGELEVRCNLRFSTELTVEAIQRRVAAILDDGGFGYRIDWRLSGLPFVTEERELIAATRAAIRAIAGCEPELSTGGGTSDGRFIAPFGAQVVELGPCNATIHAVNECCALDDLEQLTAMYRHLLASLLGSGALSNQ